jgi:hypothetical protein
VQKILMAMAKRPRLGITIVGGPQAGTCRLRVAAAREQASEIVKKLQDSRVVSFAAAA